MDYYAALGASCLLLASSLLAWKVGFYTLPRQQSPSLPAASLTKCLLFFLFFFLSFLCAALLVELILTSFTAYAGITTPTTEFLAWRMPLTSFLALLIFLYISFEFDRPTLHHLLARNIPAYIFGFFSLIVCWPILLFLSTILSPLMEWLGVPSVEQNVVQSLKSTSSSSILFFFSSLSVVIAAPLMEEILFRGLLYGSLRRRVGIPIATTLSALWFALFHYSSEYGWHNVQLMIYLFTLACYLSFLYERQRSLWAPIGLHASVNFVNVLMIYFSD